MGTRLATTSLPFAAFGITIFDATEASITETTATVGCSTTSLIGTLYYYISGDAGEPPAGDIKDGSGSVDFGNDSSITNPTTFDVVGLSAGTSYYTFFIQNDGVVDSNILGSGEWTTSAAGGPTLPPIIIGSGVGRMIGA